jgi:peptide/nickel transport system substrate-binding protein
MRTGIVAAAFYAVAATAVAEPTVIRFVPQADPGVLDPVVNSSYISMEHGYMVYDTLLAMDEHFVAQPEMLDRYSVSDDGRTYSFVLRDALRFSDGSPVGATDAVASINRWAARDTNGRRMMALGMDLQVTGERTFSLTLREPWGSVIDSLAKISGSTLFIMRERDAATAPTKPVDEIVGSGPFRFVRSEYLPASRIVYERNPDYTPRAEPANFYAGGKRVAVDRVEWRIISDAATAAAALAAGEIDIYETPSLDLVPMLKANPNVVVATHNATAMAYMRPNFLYPPFDKVEARQALLHTIDQSDYMSAAFGPDSGTWRVCWAWLACGSGAGTETGADALRHPYLAAARELLTRAGASGAKIVMLEPTDQPVLFALSEVAARRLKEVGFDVDVKAVNWATLVALRGKQDPPEKGGWNLFFTWTFGQDLAPLVNAALAAPCDRSNYAGWPCDATIEQLREAWGKASDPAQRRMVAEQLQRRAVEFVPYAPVGQFSVPIAYRKEIRRLLEVPLPVMWNVNKVQ